MCGILGLFDRRHPVSRDRLLAANEHVRHRGPDADGFWFSQDGRLALAHRRLAIIDLSESANQPMHDPDTGAVLVFNGEIYNHRELRAQLVQHGHVFRTRSDTEVLLTAYRHWGDECLEHLSGMFAFCIADIGRGELFVARDRAGEKPFFFHRTSSGFAFASELKALLSLPDFPRRIDPDALNCYLALGYVPGARCMLAGVHKLPPAHAMRIRLEDCSVRQWQYWTIPGEEERPELTADDAADALEPLLADAVRRQLAADVPVGVLLSGGLDSSLVAVLAARVSSQPIRTFSASFPGHPQHDESHFARLVATAIRSVHTEVAIASASADSLSVLVKQFDEPIADSSMVPTYLLARAAREHVTVALGGDGGDELFGGYRSYSWMQRLERYKQWVPRSMRRASASLAGTLPAGVRGRNSVVGFGGDLGDAFARTNLYFDLQLRQRLLSPLGSARSIDWQAPQRSRACAGSDGLSMADRMRRTDFRTYLPDDILVKVDRASMLASLEVRAPFLDDRVCEFAFRLPGRLTATEAARKIVLRRLAKHLLPAEFDSTRKQGFSIPLDAWLRGSWRTMFSAALDSIPPTMLDRATVREVERGAHGWLSNSQRVFALAMFGMWREHYAIEGP